MNVSGSLQTILCAGVTHLVLPRSAVELLALNCEGGLRARRRVRLRRQEAEAGFGSVAGAICPAGVDRVPGGEPGKREV